MMFTCTINQCTINRVHSTSVEYSAALMGLGQNNADSDARSVIHAGGQAKRTNIGIALVSATTKVLLLDEPTSGLDSYTATEVFHTLALDSSSAHFRVGP